jgi:hypothetical protein
MADFDLNILQNEGARPDSGASSVHVMIAAITIITIILLSWFLAATSPAAQLTTISPTTIKVVEANNMGRPQALLLSSALTTLTQMRTLSGQPITQYRMPLQSASLPEAVLVLGLGGRTRLFVNAIPVGDSQPNSLPDPVRGSHFLVSLVPTNLFNQGENRVDFVMQPSPWRTGLGVVQMGSISQVDAAVQAYESQQRIARLLSLIAGFLGIASVLILFIVSKVWAGSVSGLLTSAYLLSAFFVGNSPADTDFLVAALKWGDIVMIAAGVCALMGVLAYQNWVRGVVTGLSLSLVLAGLLALFGWRFGMSFGFVAVLIQIAPLALAGIGFAPADCRSGAKPRRSCASISLGSRTSRRTRTSSRVAGRD